MSAIAYLKLYIYIYIYIFISKCINNSIIWKSITWYINNYEVYNDDDRTTGRRKMTIYDDDADDVKLII